MEKWQNAEKNKKRETKETNKKLENHQKRTNEKEQTHVNFDLFVYCICRSTEKRGEGEGREGMWINSV